MERRRGGEERLCGSFESEELRRVRSFESEDGAVLESRPLGHFLLNGERNWAASILLGRPRMLLRQRNYSTDSERNKRQFSMEQEGDELIAHCTGNLSGHQTMKTGGLQSAWRVVPRLILSRVTIHDARWIS